MRPEINDIMIASNKEMLKVDAVQHLEDGFRFRCVTMEPEYKSIVYDNYGRFLSGPFKFQDTTIAPAKKKDYPEFYL